MKKNIFLTITSFGIISLFCLSCGSSATDSKDPQTSETAEKDSMSAQPKNETKEDSIETSEPTQLIWDDKLYGTYKGDLDNESTIALSLLALKVNDELVNSGYLIDSKDQAPKIVFGDLEYIDKKTKKSIKKHEIEGKITATKFIMKDNSANTDKVTVEFLIENGILKGVWKSDKTQKTITLNLKKV